MSKSSAKNKALEAAIDAAERCMRALKTATDEDEKFRFEEQCRVLLKEAERIKNSTESGLCGGDHSTLGPSSFPTGFGLRLAEPSSSRTLTTREEIILLEGSKLNGFVFKPWKGPPDPSEFDLKDGEEPFIDTPELPLSSSQMEVFDGWKRPEEIMLQPSIGVEDSNIGLGPTMVSHANVDLVQDITTDCSVVASLCAGTARAERGHVKMISSIVYPYDQAGKRPAISPNGKYVFRLHFNGTFRKVVIDDRLPASCTSRILHVVDRNNPRLLWPALIEKAYLKVRGGYNFPGSNSGTDLWVLTGWIPEQIFLQSEDVIPSKLWRRVYQAWRYGDVLLTLGTGKLTETEEEGLGLAGQHDYAVLDMKEAGERQLVLVKNPWSKGTIWKGSIAESVSEAGSNENEDPEASVNHRKSIASDTRSSEPGTFWMDLNNVFQNFECIYLNWNPGLFAHRQDIHFSWDLTSRRSAAGCFFGNPQYAIRSRAGGVVWLLLSRHFQTTNLNAKMDLDVTRNTFQQHLGFISLYAFGNAGQRKFQSDGALQRGPYVDSPNTLLRLDTMPDMDYTIVVAEQSLSSSKHKFTLTAFSLKPVFVAPAIEKYSFRTEQDGAWTITTAGGNANSASYSSNPQFSLRLSKPSNVALLLETSEEDLPVNVKLIWAGGDRVTGITTRDIAGDSGEYRRGCAVAEIPNVQAGVYTIVCSTFEPGQFGKFVLRIDTMVESIVKSTPVEGAGRIRPWIPPARFVPEVNRVLAPLLVRRITRFKVTAYHPPQIAGQAAQVRSPLKASIELGQGPNKTILAVSAHDEFSDSAAGVRTTDVDVLPEMHAQGGLWLVVERLGGCGAEKDERVDVELLSEGPVEIGQWGSGSG